MSGVGYVRVAQDDLADDLGRHDSLIVQRWPIWRTSNAIACFFFLMCTYVQINDPDPYIWVPVYLVPAILSLAIVVKPDVTVTTVWRVVCMVHMATCLIGLLYLLAIVVELLSEGLANPLMHEEGREMAGTAMILVWLCLCRFTTLGSNKPQQGVSKMLMCVTVLIGVFPLVLWSLCFVEGSDQSVGHCKDMFPGMLGAGFKTDTASVAVSP